MKRRVTINSELLSCEVGSCRANIPKALLVISVALSLVAASDLGHHFLWAQDTEEQEEKEERMEEDIGKASEIKKHLDEGNRLYGRLDYKAAIAEWQKILQLEASHAYAERLIKTAENNIAEEKKNWSKIESKEEPFVYHLPKKFLTVQDAIEIAIQNHPPLKIANEEIELAKLRLFEAHRELFPALSAKWDELEGVAPGGGKYDGRRYTLEAEQPIYHGGEFVYKVRQAKTNLQMANENHRKIKDELILEVKKAYYELVRAGKDMEYHRQLIEEAQIISEIIEKGYNAGVIAPLEYLNVRSQYNQAEAQFLTAQEALSLGRLTFAHVLNVDSKDEFDVDANLEFRKLEINLDDSLQAAIENRAELAMYALSRRSSYFEKMIAKSKIGPKIDAMSSYGNAGEAYKGSDLNLEEEWYIGTKVSWPFGGSTAEYSFTDNKYAPSVGSYQGTEATKHSTKMSLLNDLASISKEKEKGIEYEKARYQLGEIREKVVVEVKEAFFEFEKSAIQINASEAGVAFREKEVALLKMRSQMGEGEYSDYLESQLRLLQARSSYAKSLAEYYTAVAKINKAIGISDYYKF